MKPLSPTELQDLAAKADASPTVAFMGDDESDKFYSMASPDTIKRLLTMVSEAREVLEDMLDTAKVRDMSSIANPPVFRARELLARWNGGGQ